MSPKEKAKEAQDEARKAASEALLAAALRATEDESQDPLVLAALCREAHRLAVVAGNQEAAKKAQERGKEARKRAVAAAPRFAGLRVVVRHGSKDRTLAGVRVPEEEATDELCADLAAAFRAVCEEHGVVVAEDEG